MDGLGRFKSVLSPLTSATEVAAGDKLSDVKGKGTTVKQANNNNNDIMHSRLVWIF
jgi:hypothetical protein